MFRQCLGVGHAFEDSGLGFKIGAFDSGRGIALK